MAMGGLACGWNALVLDLRQRDLLSNRELACLTFEELQLTAQQKDSLLRLPHVARLGLTTVLPARCVCVRVCVHVRACLCVCVCVCLSQTLTMRGIGRALQCPRALRNGRRVGFASR
jgi:hypothetical protein